MPDTTAIAAPRTTAPDLFAPRRGAGPPASAAEASDDLAAALVDALTVAWTMFRVYHDPRPHDAFRRAVDTLGAVPALPWTVEIHSGGFRHADRPVPTRRQAAPALARAIFARGIAVLGFSAPPTGDDLVRLFEVISFQGSTGAAVPGPAEALRKAGATRLIVVEHGRLIEMPEGLEATEELIAPDGEGSSAEGRHGDPSRRYMDEYRLLYERLRTGDFQGLQELVHGFTDSFFALPREQQTHLFEQFLTRHEEEPFRLLLDQFSQDDLAELAHLLSPGTHPLLVEYARIAVEQEGQSAASEQMLPAGQLVSDRISQLLRTERAGLRRQVGEALRAQVPGPEENLSAGVRVASALFAVTDDAGFARLARTAAVKAAAAFTAGDLQHGASWGGALLAFAHSRDRKETVRREMEAALRPEILDALIPAVAAHPDPPPAAAALVTLFALDQAVEHLAAEEDMGKRKQLVAFLTAAARVRPGPVIRRLSDPRWHLVRNLVDILSHSGRVEAVAGLREACRHADHRVRREAVRALFLLDRDEAAAATLRALKDPEAALRLQALSLLRHCPGSAVDAAIGAFLAARPALEERLAAVDLLAKRRSAPARAELRRLARRRLWASAATREAGRAARRALGRGAR